MGYIVVTETSLELIPRDGVDICMGVTICFPPICCHTKELVHGKKNFLSIRALGNHDLLLNSTNLRLPFGPWLVRRWWGEFTGTPPNETGVVVKVEALVAGELGDWAAYY
jgi:hypothetical protein